MERVEPKRVSHGYTQRILASPARIFPLYCPVREIDWVVGWDPVAVHSLSGLVEQDCVFTTRDHGREAVWVVTLHDPENFRVEIVKVTPGVTACRLAIALEPLSEAVTAAHVRYTQTAIGPDGAAVVDAFTEQAYATFMRTWEDEMNHYLETGDRLAPGG